jgi:putative FmdB family regulatory protein
MPLYEYLCNDCGRLFEALITAAREPECPACHSRQLAQQLSSFSVRAASSSRPATACGAPAGSCASGGCCME